jgi:zinc transport system substrate-binding protein
LVVLMAVIGAGCARRQPAATEGGKLLVAASILPMADFARQVGGDRVEVQALIPPGISEHVYEPTAAQLEMLSKARLLVLNGVGLEFWADKAVGAVSNPELLVVKTAQGLPILASPDKDEAQGDPHVWLDPLDAIHQVEAIRDALIRVDPGSADAYRGNAAAYVKQLEQLDAYVRGKVAGFSSRDFIAFHAAWGYFARRYGLHEAAVIERTPGREPSPEEIANIVRTAKAIKAKVIFAEHQFSTKAADVIAAESGARVLTLDPLGIPPDYEYIKTLRYDVDEMAKAMS